LKHDKAIHDPRMMDKHIMREPVMEPHPLYPIAHEAVPVKEAIGKTHGLLDETDRPVLVDAGAVEKTVAFQPSKTHGTKDVVVGGVKQGVGKAVGSDHMEAKGALQKNAGKMERHKPTKLHGAKDQVLGGLKEAVGKVVGSTTLEGKGEAQKDAGKIEKEAADVQHDWDKGSAYVNETAKHPIGK